MMYVFIRNLRSESILGLMFREWNEREVSL